MVAPAASEAVSKLIAADHCVYADINEPGLCDGRPFSVRTRSTSGRSGGSGNEVSLALARVSEQYSRCARQRPLCAADCELPALRALAGSTPPRGELLAIRHKCHGYRERPTNSFVTPRPSASRTRRVHTRPSRVLDFPLGHPCAFFWFSASRRVRTAAQASCPWRRLGPSALQVPTTPISRCRSCSPKCGGRGGSGCESQWTLARRGA